MLGAIAQPALSRSIRNLEETFGLAVVERGPRGVEVTKYGNALLKYARIIDANLRFAADELGTLPARPAGVVRIGIGSFEGRALGARAIARLIKRQPGTEISIIDGNSSILLPRLLSSDIDLGASLRNDGRRCRRNSHCDEAGDRPSETSGVRAL